MVRFGERKISKEEFYVQKKTLKVWDVNVDNIVISKSVNEYLDKAIRPFVFIMPKMSGYVQTFKVKDGHKDKNNKLSFSV